MHHQTTNKYLRQYNEKSFSNPYLIEPLRDNEIVQIYIIRKAVILFAYSRQQLG